VGGFAAYAQDYATLTVTVVDPSAAVVPGAKTSLSALQRGVVTEAETNETGFVVFDLLQPGDYSLDVVKPGFDLYRVPRLSLQIRDRQTIRIALKLSVAAGTTIEVTASAQPLSSDVAQVASMDHDYLQNLPTNGRSTEALIGMAPGISSSAGGRGDGGFNANGLRSNTNYYTLDGVSMNRPTGGPGPGGAGGPGGPGGGPPGGGVSGDMISMDSMQEIKVQTSSFAPEFGRTPGAQVVMSSRGGSNSLHGSLFYYGRRDRFDANDWFANSGGYPKAREQQNRPGGVLGGPVVKNRLFFFFSYERVGLFSPQSVIADVPNAATRATAPASLGPYLNAFPLPNSISLPDDAAEYRAVVSNPSKDYSASARVDYTLGSSTVLFGRYSLSPSSNQQRGSENATPNVLTIQSSHSSLVTTGLTHVFAGGAVDDLRVNYSDSSSSQRSITDSYGGAVPLTDAEVFPAGVTSATGSFSLNIIGAGSYSFGGSTSNEQRQVNVVDSFTKVRKNHHLKAGLDFRELLQTNHRPPYSASFSFNGITGSSESLLTGIALNGQVASNMVSVYPTYRNVSLYAQDTWRFTDRTTFTYGLRWELNPAPTTREGPKPFALSSSNIAGVTENQPIYPTRWTNIAPRFGVTYLSDDTPGREMMLRAGFGLFYDLGYGVVDGAFNGAPYSNITSNSLVSFPAAANTLQAPGLPATRPYGQVTTGDPGLVSPIVYQWNGTWEKNFGPGQMLSIGVAGTRGVNLMRTATMPSFSSAYTILQEVTNGASSAYNGVPIQFRKRISSSFQTQLSYTWAHSVDSSSNDAGFGGGFASLFGGGQRGNSDYDVRHTLSFSGSLLIPAPRQGFLWSPLRHWYVDYIYSARTGLPFDIQGVSSSTSSASTTNSSVNGLFAMVRPDYNGQAIWLKDPHAPGGRRLNRSAFDLPSGYQQGDLGRNSLRGFSFGQLDFSVRRVVPISERLQINFAAEAYNVFNHPNFANPSAFEGANMSSPNFGQVTEMMSQSGGGGASLYRNGGARSMELTIRLQF
jgi:hypothetical protein